jgi:uncharacterized protein
MTTTEQRVETALKAAIQARDDARRDVLREIKTQILSARLVGAGLELTDDVCVNILRSILKQHENSASIYDAQHRADLAATERFQIAVIEEFIPTKVTEAEIRTLAKEVIAQTGATSRRDTGKVMSELVQRLSKRSYDSSTVSNIVNQLLA